MLRFHLSVKAPSDWSAVNLLGADEACEFIVNEDSRRNATSAVGAGVYRYPVPMHLRKFATGDGVSVDDSLLELASEFDEAIPDPPEIMRVLIRHLDARPNTRMHEAEIGGFHLVDCRLQHFEVMIVKFLKMGGKLRE